MKNSGNTILITGGTSGIGLGLAVRWQEAGNKVIVAGRRKELLDQITTEHRDISAMALDVVDPASITHAVRTVAENWPDLNVLVNNAGIMREENLGDPDDVRIAEDEITTNLLGTIRMTYAFLPSLAAKPDAVIVNVSSALGFVPLPSAPTYSATKAALHSFTESLRVLLADTAVQVIEMIPPGVRTTLFDQQDDERAMPLPDFLTDTMTLLRTEPNATEIVVDRAKPLRTAQANGTYDDILAMLSSYRRGEG